MRAPTPFDEKLEAVITPDADGRVEVGSNMTLCLCVIGLLIVRALRRIERAIDSLGPI